MNAIRLKLGQVCSGKRDIKCRRIPHNMNHSMHWKARSDWNKAWYVEVKYAWLSIPWSKRPEIPLKIPKIAIKYYTIHLLDFDNAYTAAKPLVDGLRDAGILKNDDLKNLPSFQVTQEKVSHREDEHVEIEIAE